MPKSKRSRLEIIEQTLVVASEPNGITKTQLVYRTNSTFVRINKLLAFLIGKGLLEKNKVNGVLCYKTTKTGMIFNKEIGVVLSTLRLNKSLQDKVPDYNLDFNITERIPSDLPLTQTRAGRKRALN